MTRVLVTGGAGFIGSNLVDRLVDEGSSVSIIDNLSTGNIKNVNKKARLYNIDIRDASISDVFKKEKPEYVFHHAAQIDVQKSIKDPAYDGDINIIGSINVIENCKRYGIKKIIYASSAAVYGMPEYLPVDEKHRLSPISYYGISKHTPEYYIKVYSDLYGLKYTIFRYANVYGIRQDPKGEGGVISIFIDKLLKDEAPTIFGDGKQTRDFIYVDDIVEANIKALSYGDNEVLNISTNNTVTINETYDLMRNIMDKSYNANYGEERSGDIRHSCLDNSKAVELLEWRPVFSVKDGLKKTIDYYR